MGIANGIRRNTANVLLSKIMPLFKTSKCLHLMCSDEVRNFQLYIPCFVCL